MSTAVTNHLTSSLLVSLALLFATRVVTKPIIIKNSSDDDGGGGGGGKCSNDNYVDCCRH